MLFGKAIDATDVKCLQFMIVLGQAFNTFHDSFRSQYRASRHNYLRENVSDSQFQIDLILGFHHQSNENYLSDERIRIHHTTESLVGDPKTLPENQSLELSCGF